MTPSSRDRTPRRAVAAAGGERGRDALIRALVHDLRNPLNIVLTWTHLLADGRLDAEARTRAIASIRSESERQARLLSDVAEFCALAGGRGPLELGELDPRAVVTAAVERARAASPGGAARLETDLDSADGPLTGDAERLDRAVGALLARALEPANGARTVRIGLRGTPRRVEIEVADDGAGFAPEERARLFEPVVESARGSGGLRFELPIASLVAQAHGGRLAAASRGKGRGATLTLRLPRDGQPRPRSASTVRTTSSRVSGGVGFRR